MKTCDLKEIIYLPSGIFTYTSIKTCVFYFVKKREGTDVLETKIKVSKTQKETGRDYKFSKTHQTTKVKFYDYNPYEDVKNLLVEVPIEKIVSNSYSLNYAEYMKDETEEEQYEEGVVVKTLGEVCNFQNGYSFKSTDYEKQNDTNIGILQIKSIQNRFIDENKITEYIEENKKYKLFEIQKGDILIALSGATTGKIGIYNLEQKSYLNQRVGKINAKTGISQKYIYYWYVCCNIYEKILNLAQGTAQPNISTNDISNIKIPIPSLDKQNEIVQYLDFIYEKSNKTSEEKIKELKQLNEFCLNNQINYGNNTNKTLGEVCEVNQGNSLTKTEMNIGIYNVIGGGKIIGKHNEKNRDGNEFTLTRVGDININYIDNPYYLTDNGFSLKSKQEDIMTKYIYYLLSHNKNYLTNLYKGLAQKVISKTNLKLIKIPIPSIKKQREIIEYCDRNCELIKQLENEIKNNKKIAKEFLDNILDLPTDTNESEMIEDDESYLKTRGLDDTDESDLKINEEEEYDVEFEE
jgi:type I restriction enzyme S subunit